MRKKLLYGAGFIVILIIGVVILLVVNHFRNPPYIDFTNKFASEVKLTVDPAKLQSWAHDVLQKYLPGKEIPNSEIPQFIREIPAPNLTAYVLGGVGPDDNVVMLSWGGGFGHWGIIVGSPTLSIPKDKNYHVEWVKGIYFYHD